MKIRIEFSKHGLMRYIGHLDMMRYFQKAIRRAEIDITYTEGFSPHQMMSFAHPLGVGVESDSEYLDIEVNSTYSSKEAIQRLNASSAEGIEVLSYVQLPDNAKSGMAIVDCADYIIGTKRDYEPLLTQDQLIDALQGFLAQEEINIVKKTKKSESLTNIKPWIVELCPASFSDIETEDDYYNHEGALIFLKCRTGSANNLKPALFAEAFATYLGKEFAPFSIAVTRKEVYGNIGTEEAPIYQALKDYGTEIA